MAIRQLNLRMDSKNMYINVLSYWCNISGNKILIIFLSIVQIYILILLLIIKLLNLY